MHMAIAVRDHPLLQRGVCVQLHCRWPSLCLHQGSTLCPSNRRRNSSLYRRSGCGSCLCISRCRVLPAAIGQGCLLRLRALRQADAELWGSLALQLPLILEEGVVCHRCRSVLWARIGACFMQLPMRQAQRAAWERLHTDMLDIRAPVVMACRRDHAWAV